MQPPLPKVIADYDRSYERIEWASLARNDVAVAASRKQEEVQIPPMDTRWATPSQGSRSVSRSESMSSTSTGYSSQRPASASRCPPARQHPQRPSSGKSLDSRRRHLARSSASAPSLDRPQRAAEERKEYLQAAKQRRWLEGRGKHCYVNFSDAERSELRRYFDAWTESQDLMGLETLKHMLLSLNLAKCPKEIESFSADIQSGELSFKEFLAMIESRIDQGTLHVFKKMLSGELGHDALDYRTIVGAHQRNFIFDAIGARQGAGMAPKESEQVMRNYASLMEKESAKSNTRRGALRNIDVPAPVGGMGTMWQVTCKKNGLTPTLSADERSKHMLEKPLSPRSVIQRVMSAATPQPLGCRRLGRTIIIDAPDGAAPTKS